jgi:pyruvate formate lyase activating enzyme
MTTAMKRAMFQEPQAGKDLTCGLCSHRCHIPDGKLGLCSVRENEGGILYSLVYDKVIAQNIDPIEKKPLFHFQPGSQSYSIAAPGCNFRCRHCQNSDISQLPREMRGRIIGSPVAPTAIVLSAQKAQCASISYTYTEPTIFFELAYDTATCAKNAGIRNVFVTNGYITAEALSVIGPVLDAANIDLKSFSDDFYRRICGARLAPVLDSIRNYKKAGIWIEITTLIIPGHNDSDVELRQIAEFIRSVGEEIPWHVSRFHPTYKLTNAGITPVETLKRARQIGIEAGLRYVYEGNVPGEGEDTLCWSCGKTLIRRVGYRVIENTLTHGTCGHCGAVIDGVWS